MISSLFGTGNGKPKTYEPCIHHSNTQATPCSECRAETSSRRGYRYKLIFCLIWPYALQALDSTIIASAMPVIALDFGKLTEQNWIASAFNLTSAAFIPFWAQIADVFGRNVAMTSATVIMFIGSALCTAAPTSAYPMLLLGRALQGVAASGLSVLTRTILADGLSLQESAKNWAIFAFIGGVAYGLGPVAGGYLANSNWRWCFGINLPIGAVALIVITIFLRKHLLGPQPIPELDETFETGRRTKFLVRLKTIDIGGQSLFIVGFGLIILSLTWGGATYSWKSAAVLLPLFAGFLLIISFAIWERQLAPGRYLSRKFPLQKAMIPWAMISTRDIGLLFFTECVSGMAMFSVLYFCNIYFIGYKLYAPEKAGLQLLFFTPGIGVGVYSCSFLCNRWPRMSFPPLLLGALIEVIGIGVLTWAMNQGHSPTIFGMMALTGVGTGLRFMSAPLHGIGFFKEARAAVIAVIAVSVPLGGTIGLTVMSSVFNNAAGGDILKTIDFEALRKMPPEQTLSQVNIIKTGVVYAYISIIPFLGLSLVCSLFFGNVALGDQTSSNVAQTEDTVIREPYLWYLAKGRKYHEVNEGIAMQKFSEQKGTELKSDRIQVV